MSLTGYTDDHTIQEVQLKLFCSGLRHTLQGDCERLATTNAKPKGWNRALALPCQTIRPGSVRRLTQRK